MLASSVDRPLPLFFAEEEGFEGVEVEAEVEAEARWVLDDIKRVAAGGRETKEASSRDFVRAERLRVVKAPPFLCFMLVASESRSRHRQRTPDTH